VPLLILEDPSRFRLEVRLDEARARDVSVGQAVGVRFDERPSSAWQPGTVSEIARVDAAGHSFVVKIELAEAALAASVRSGVFGYARFAGPTRQSIVVPSTAVVHRGQLAFVYVVDGEGSARLRPVSIGSGAGTRTEILAGLQPGESVVAAPPPALADGARVRSAS
jgi:RND family efflux transporter MFP subunit